MAFIKRTWFARIGTGLNKFLIGAPDGNGKQTLTNSPDSVTQQGDVISADNLNDLEDRIYNADINLQEQIDDLKKKVVYGFHINGNDSNPDTMVTYLRDAVGMTPAHMDYANDVFDYGSWQDAFFMPRPCMVKYDGTVDYYLDPNDYTKKADGTPSDIANTMYGGNAMMEWGQNGKKIWLAIVPDSDPKSGSIYIADHQVDETPSVEC